MHCAAQVWSLGCVLFALTCGFFAFDKANNTDWRFNLAVATQAVPASTVRAIFGMYGRPCHLSDELVELLDGMLIVDPAARMTLDDVVASAWVSNFAFPPALEQCVPLHPALSRLRARMRLAQLGGRVRCFNRALRVMLHWYESDIRLRPGNTGALALAQHFYEHAAMLDSMPHYRSCGASSASSAAGVAHHTHRNEARRLELVEEWLTKLQKLGQGPTPPPIVRQRAVEGLL